MDHDHRSEHVAETGVAANLEAGCGPQPPPGSGSGPRVPGVCPVLTTGSGAFVSTQRRPAVFPAGRVSVGRTGPPCVTPRGCNVPATRPPTAATTGPTAM